MKTNVLWKCHYCDKTLCAKRNVLLHISVIHKQDGNNPVMYSKVMVSPKDVKSFLKTSAISPESLPSDSTQTHLTSGTPESLPGDSTQTHLTTGTPESLPGDSTQTHLTTSIPESLPGASTHNQLPTDTPESLPGDSTQGHLTTGTAHENNHPPPKVKKLNGKKKISKDSKKPKSKQTCYDFKRLANIFNTDLVEELNLYKKTPKKQIIPPVGGTLSLSSDGNCPTASVTQPLHDDRVLHLPDGTIQHPALDSNQYFPGDAQHPAEYVDVSTADPLNTSADPVNTRKVFYVPYKRKPRGKCTDWLNCPSCSITTDCGECSNCLDKSLQ